MYALSLSANKPENKKENERVISAGAKCVLFSGRFSGKLNKNLQKFLSHAFCEYEIAKNNIIQIIQKMLTTPRKLLDTMVYRRISPNRNNKFM
jgi:hypothetical protein